MINKIETDISFIKFEQGKKNVKIKFSYRSYDQSILHIIDFQETSIYQSVKQCSIKIMLASLHRSRFVYFFSRFNVETFLERISLYIQRGNVSRTRRNYTRFVDCARLFALWKSSNSRVSRSHCRLRWQFSLDIRLFMLTRGSKFNCFSPGCVAFESSREFLKPSQWLPTKRTMLFPASYVDPSMFHLKRNSFAYFSSLFSISLVWFFASFCSCFIELNRFLNE